MMTSEQMMIAMAVITMVITLLNKQIQNKREINPCHFAQTQF